MERLEREAERQSAEREKDRAIELEMMMEKAKLEMEHEFKMKQLEMGRSGERGSEGADEEEAGEDGEGPVVRVRAPGWEETLAGRTKRFAIRCGMFCRRCRRTLVKSLNILKISSICLTFTRCLLICGPNW